MQVLPFRHPKLIKEVSNPFVDLEISRSLVLFFYIVYVEHTLNLIEVGVGELLPKFLLTNQHIRGTPFPPV